MWVNEFNKFSEVGAKMIKVKTVLEIKIQNQTITLVPSISEVRSYWYK